MIKENPNSAINYINFKLESLLEQKEHPVKLDIYNTKKHKYTLEYMLAEKVEELSKVMDQDLGKIIKKKPKVLYKKNGELSHYGTLWFEFLEKNNIDKNVEVVREKPNPLSHSQLKTWLFRLGWKPDLFKVSKETGKKLPQVSKQFGAGLTDSVLNLIENNPEIEHLNSLYKIQHRLGLFKSYLDNEKNGYVTASAHGLARSLRLKHMKPLVNLPKPDSFFGHEIRAMLTIPNKDWIMWGSDVSGLEDNTKRHFIYPFDPDYVNEMKIPGFDAHLDIAVLANLLTKEEEILYKELNNKKDLSPEEIIVFAKLKKTRGLAKTVNFAATYNAGAPKLKETLKCSIAFAENLHKTYWHRNWAIKAFVKTIKIKVVNNFKWCYNPVSHLWYSLGAEKDIFSVINQSAGDYVFSTWKKNVKELIHKYDYFISFETHDEIMGVCRKEDEDLMRRLLQEGMDKTNKQLKLNVVFGISTEFGNNYAEVH